MHSSSQMTHRVFNSDDDKNIKTWDPQPLLLQTHKGNSEVIWWPHSLSSFTHSTLHTSSKKMGWSNPVIRLFWGRQVHEEEKKTYEVLHWLEREGVICWKTEPEKGKLGRKKIKLGPRKNMKEILYKEVMKQIGSSCRGWENWELEE